jgi:microcystin-dependent protein
MEEYMGDIKLCAGTYSPQDYMYCDGQQLEVQQYQALFAILGTQYGGDGLHTFCLPDLNKNPILHGTALKYIICTQGIFPARAD